MKKRGPAKDTGMCQNCYDEGTLVSQFEALDSWRDTDVKLYQETDYTRSTLFLGNLPYESTDRDLAMWIAQRIDKLSFKEKVYWKIKKIVRSGHHVYEKCFKAFAFVDFHKVEHAYKLKQDVDKDGREQWQGRRIPMHPAVQQLWMKPPEQQRLFDRADTPRDEP